MIAEIVGVAGTGKSTIAQAIAQRSSIIQTDYQLRWRYVLPTYYARALLAMPIYINRYRDKGQVFWSALRWMTYLEKLHHTLSKLDNEKSHVLFDQGPVYWFTYLYTFGSDGIRDECFTRWWMQALKDWSLLLDIVFLLDCDDAIIIERVRNRSKTHKLQDLSDQEKHKFLARYREGYRYVISRLTAGDGPTVYYLSTNWESPEQITDKILLQLLTKYS